MSFTQKHTFYLFDRSYWLEMDYVLALHLTVQSQNAPEITGRASFQSKRFTEEKKLLQT